MAVIVAVFGPLWRLAWHPVGGPLTLLAAGLVLRWLWPRRTRRRQGDAPVHPGLVELRRALSLVETRLRRHGLERPPSGTVRELAGAVRAAKGIPGAAAIADLLLDYETIRYQPVPPSAEEARRFAERLAQSLNQAARS